MRIAYAASWVLLVAAFALLGHVSASSESSAPPLLYTVAKKYQGLAWLQGGERFPVGAQIFVQTGSERHPLVRGFVASADPAVSYDGARVLFAGKVKATGPWQIYEIQSCRSSCRRAPEG